MGYNGINVDISLPSTASVRMSVCPLLRQSIDLWSRLSSRLVRVCQQFCRILFAIGSFYYEYFFIDRRQLWRLQRHEISLCGSWEN